MRKIRITESQYENYLLEATNGKTQVDVPIVGDKNSLPKQVGKEVNDTNSTTNKIKQLGGQPVIKATPTDGNTTIQTQTTDTTQQSTFESRIVSKRQLDEYRLKMLKENSKLYTVKDFMGK